MSFYGQNDDVQLLIHIVCQGGWWDWTCFWVYCVSHLSMLSAETRIGNWWLGMGDIDHSSDDWLQSEPMLQAQPQHHPLIGHDYTTFQQAFINEGLNPELVVSKVYHGLDERWSTRSVVQCQLWWVWILLGVDYLLFCVFMDTYRLLCDARC